MVLVQFMIILQKIIATKISIKIDFEMKKTIYLVRGEKGESYGDFKDRIFKIATTVVQKYHPSTLKVVLTEELPPVISIIPFRKKKIAVISIQNEKTFECKELKNEKGFTSFFEVTEALPVAYNKIWDDGIVTPGVCLLTLFNKKTNIEDATFINRWHNSHTPLSLKIHPLTHYNRNVVDKKATNNTESWDGIVEEHTKTKSDLLNPTKFFGGGLKMIPNMMAVYMDTKSFLDYKTIETYLTKEYFFKS
jgi:hypothetical protein